jgi:hypothetical protein
MSDKLKTGESKMKNFLIAATALATLASAPAFAAPQTETIAFTGTMNATCTAGPTGGTSVPLGNISGSGVGALDASKVNVTLGSLGSNIECNGAGTKLSIQAGVLENLSVTSLPAGSGAAGFSREVDFTATIDTTGLGYTSGVDSVSDSSTLAASTEVVVGLTDTDASLTLSLAAIKGGDKLIAGNYRGQVQLTLTPGV